MTLIRDVKNKVAREWGRRRFESTAQKIRRTPPIEYERDASVVIVSQVYHAAVDMTLIAIKSFLWHFGRGTVELIDDGSLTGEDKKTLIHHIPDVRIIHIQDIALGSCPAGGCWERLAYIIARSSDAYVIQVDTDTVTSGPVNEVDTAVRGNTSFCIGGPMWQDAVHPEYMRTVASSWKSNHVQALCEINLPQVTSIVISRYLRGCAAFSGFSKGGFSSQELSAFSEDMQELVGEESWQKWGTEQFTSNVFVSSDESSFVLPWPKYNNFRQPTIKMLRESDRVFVHYIGSYRFDTGAYRRNVHAVIEKYLKTV